ncbi:SGNH/GDSL hydrolase family protein [Puia dinghuensis]|uniref:Lysophospholipase n=1 Tax=Puia dinghuensis TaxID=1792502 RepID=A0A8J2U6V9_9BACT|nr:SGNH/GDSL hydrolase family protein [Puia dinghuensis]GGA83125.1 lysophospholipase [Puia dinghuensis]
MHTLLCLGDSYTIGEGVPLYLGYPYQTVQLLRTAGHEFCAPEIIARTGWTTDELSHTLSTLRLLPHYDFVTLLIGVNDQYRGRDTSEYAREFKPILQRATGLAGAPSKVFVLSIPDWGYSPFGASRNKTLISGEIDAFNEVAKEITLRQKTPFIDITTHSRTEGASPDSFTADGLHPSAPTYLHWAQLVAGAIAATIPAPLFPDE